MRLDSRKGHDWLQAERKGNLIVIDGEASNGLILRPKHAVELANKLWELAIDATEAEMTAAKKCKDGNRKPKLCAV